MKTKLPVPAFLLVILIATNCQLSFGGGKPQPGYQFSSIEIFNEDTAAYGISQQGLIAGRYNDSSSTSWLASFSDDNYHGFVQGDMLALIDAPAALGANTIAYGINRKGQVVGSFMSISGTLHFSGFLKDDSTFESFDFPDATDTFAQGINEAGQIVGSYTTCDDSGTCQFHGFLRDKNEFSTIDVPIAGATDTYVHGINQFGEIVGWYTDSDGKNHGFLINRAGFYTLDVDGADGTMAYGINPKGRIVGAFIDDTGKSHGFIEDNGQLTLIDPPGAAETAACGINRRGDIVGWYIDTTGKRHGFLAQ